MVINNPILRCTEESIRQSTFTRANIIRIGGLSYPMSSCRGELSAKILLVHVSWRPRLKLASAFGLVQRPLSSASRSHGEGCSTEKSRGAHAVRVLQRRLAETIFFFEPDSRIATIVALSRTSWQGVGEAVSAAT